MGNIDYDYWDSTPFPGNFAWCKQHYSHLKNAGIPIETTIYTAIIVLCSLWLEVIAHSDIRSHGSRILSHDGNDTRPDPQDIEAANETHTDEESRRDSGIGSSSDSQNTHVPILAPAKSTVKKTWQRATLHTLTRLQPPNFSSITSSSQQSQLARPTVRYARLLLSTPFYTIILTSFILRMQDVRFGNTLLYGCQNYIPVPRMSLLSVVLLNILPFICACAAWLRCVVDCVLLKWKLGVHYNWRKGWYNERGVVWMPFMPLVGVVWVVYGLGRGIARIVRSPGLVLRGFKSVRLPRWKRSMGVAATTREIKMEEDEDVGLLRGGSSRRSTSAGETDLEIDRSEKIV